jgi:AcrR family transcriptional regulator
MAITTRPLRRDAEENRQRLLDSASELFAARGLCVTLNDIAHHAGVGVGTAYRRFPNKEAVIDALFEERLQAVEALAHESLEEPDAWRGFVHYLFRSTELRAGDRGLDEIMNSQEIGDSRRDDVRVRIAPLIIKLVDRAKEQGSLRPDFAPTDVAFIQTAMSAIMESSRDLSSDLYERYLTYVVDGIRFDRGLSELPRAALTSDRTHFAMTSKRRRRDSK